MLAFLPVHPCWTRRKTIEDGLQQMWVLTSMSFHLCVCGGGGGGGFGCLCMCIGVACGKMCKENAMTNRRQNEMRNIQGGAKRDEEMLEEGNGSS